MKKIFSLLAIILLFSGCSNNTDNNESVYYDLLPVYDFELPASFDLGETYLLKIRYARPSSCHGFNQFYYKKELNVRTIAIESTVFVGSNCTTYTDTVLAEQFLEFKVTNNGSYIFKFWKGKDAQGVDQYEEVEVPVN